MYLCLGLLHILDGGHADQFIRIKISGGRLPLIHFTPLDQSYEKQEYKGGIAIKDKCKKK